MQFSLFHHAAPPQSKLASKPPVLLLLHGYGASEDDLFAVAPYADARFLVISPRAPVTLGAMSHAWFHLGFTPQGIQIDPSEIESSRMLLRKFIDEVVAHYDADPNAVYLAGFSQGAMMSLAVALTFPGVAAGVVAMSGRVLPQTMELITNRDALIGLPIFVAHGTRDNVVPVGHARATRESLENLSVELQYREYPFAHEISAESLSDVTMWLTAQLDKRASGRALIH